jgi:hypothetical protein
MGLAKTIFAARPLKAAKVCFTICQNKALTHHMPRYQKSLLVFRRDWLSCGLFRPSQPGAANGQKRCFEVVTNPEIPPCLIYTCCY